MSIDWNNFEEWMNKGEDEDEGRRPVRSPEHPFAEEILMFQEFDSALEEVGRILIEAKEQYTEGGELVQRFEIALGRVNGALMRLMTLDSTAWRHMFFLPHALRATCELSGDVPEYAIAPFQAMVRKYLEIMGQPPE